MEEKDQALELIKLLAGAAQAGASGKVALAALRVMKASEAAAVAQSLNSNFDSALTELKSAQGKLAEAMQDPTAMDQARRDLEMGGGRTYSFE